MGNKAIAGKVSSTSKAGSPSDTSLKSVSKSSTKTPKRQVTVTLVSTGKQVKNPVAATRTVMAVPPSRAKAAKSIAVEPAQKPSKKATQKTAMLSSVSSSSNTVAKKTKNVTKTPKLLKTTSAR